MELDLLIHAKTVLTMDPKTPRATRIGIWDGRIVGVDTEVEHLPAREHLDLQSCTVVPGLRDAHCHTTSVGIVRQHLDLTGADSTEAALDLLARRSRGRDQHEPIVGFGWGFGMGTGLAPTHAQLAAASANREVLLVHRSGHRCVVSTPLLQRIEQQLSQVDPQFVMRNSSGEESGVLAEAAMDCAKEALGVGRTDDLVAAIDDATADYLTLGLTGYTEAGIGCPGLDHSPVEIAAYQRARDQRRLHVRATLMVYSEQLHSLQHHPQDGETFGLDLGMRSGFGDPWLRLGAMKLWADGAGSSDGPPELVQDPALLTARIVAAHRAGWQVAVHAMGDRAVDVFLAALEVAGPREEVRGRRHRIEHGGMIRADQVRKIADMGLIVVIQPAFIDDFGDSLTTREPHHVDVIRARSLLISGVVVAASSDAPVANPSPLAGITSLVRRRTGSGSVLGPSERLRAEEALRCYTHRAAYADHLEDALGSITSRKLADLTVLSHDPVTTPADQLDQIEVTATIIDGEVVFSRGPRLSTKDSDRA